MTPPVITSAVLERSQFTWALVAAREMVKGALRIEKVRGPQVPQSWMISSKNGLSVGTDYLVLGSRPR
jgi:hypothetical protein